jgi:hypothetical protein
MAISRERIGSVIGGTAVAAALALSATLHQPAPAEVQGSALNIPTVEQMCISLGAADPQSMMECQALESSAGEYVIAWMGLNGFITNGNIDIEAIQLIAMLDETNAVDPLATYDPTTDPSLALDPDLGGLTVGADPLAGNALGGVTDPLTGNTSPTFASPAQLAVYCLSGAVDWITLQECISMNDPSTQLFGGVQ